MPGDTIPIRALDEVQEILEHPGATAWDTIYKPLLWRVPLPELEEETGIRLSLFARYRKGLVKPSPRQMNRMIRALRHDLYRPVMQVDEMR